MQELKGLNTTEFYSRFFVETALDKHVVANKEQVNELNSIGEAFLTRYHKIDSRTPYDVLFEHQSWFHTELLLRLGYSNLGGFFHRTNGQKGLPVRGKLNLIDDEELWVIEGPFGMTKKEIEPTAAIPHCSSLKIFGDQDEELEIDKSCDYMKHFRNILSEENKCTWILFLAGEKTYLFERGKTLETGSYIEVDWPEVFSNKDNNVAKAILGLLGYKAFKVVNGDIAHHQLAETAHREAHGVTKNLKFGVRDALELIINEALESHRKNPTDHLSKLEKELSSDELAKALADEGLRYLYRLLFLFFVESRGQDSDILPVKSQGYSLGYSLENIRNLELKKISGAGDGNYIQNTLSKTFEIMFYGVSISQDEQADNLASGFECPRVGTLLFDKRKTPILEGVKLRDREMRKVISKLSISEMGKGKKKKMARISYANLGLNQLGAVYEGLLSLKPIITDDEYYTATLGTRDEEFLIPKSDKSKFEKDKLLHDNNGELVLHKPGEFLFRTMGYERKYSASFYTDETLTKCLVKECLDEHFKNDNGEPTCEKIEKMKILEPAMGSGAFLNEVANQLAVYYADALTREERHKKMIEVKKGNKIEKEEVEKDRVELVNEAKEYIMRHSLYGVDLNPMAAELAKVSLWLNCVNKKGSFAFHDFKIRRGNSLVGAFLRQPCHFDKDIYHFLVPLPAMVDTYINAVELKDKKRPFFDEKQIEKLKNIKKDFERTSDHKDELTSISKAIKDLYKAHTRKRDEFRDTVNNGEYTTSEMEEIFAKYMKENTEYRKVRAIMDYWCSLWFWSPEEIASYPDTKQFISNVTDIIEKGETKFKHSKQVRECIQRVPYFHYDLEFPEVFEGGGFDLVLGNPPWAQLSWSDSDFFCDINHSYLVQKIEAKKEQEIFSKVLRSSSVLKRYREGMITLEGTRSFLASSKTYSFRDRSKTNTYKFFWQRSHILCKEKCIYGLIKRGGILTDKGTECLRPTYYRELVSLYSFINEKNLFDVDHKVHFVVGIFSKASSEVNFKVINNLYHPVTIERCKKAPSSDPYPGEKDDQGGFEVKGHPDRIVEISEEHLKLISRLDGERAGDHLQISLPRMYGKPDWEILEVAINSKKNLGDIDYYWSLMFSQTSALKKGLIDYSVEGEFEREAAVLTGSNIYVGNPFFKQYSEDEEGKSEFNLIDLREVGENFFPLSKYSVTETGKQSSDYLEDSNQGYKIIARSYVGTGGSRTLQSALYPPHVCNIDNLCSFFVNNSQRDTVSLQGFFQSLIYDFYAKNLGDARLNKDSFWNKLPYLIGVSEEIQLLVDIRTLRLNCLSSDYSDLWSEIFDPRMSETPVLQKFAPDLSYRKLSENWDYSYALRDLNDREQALCEVDALVSILFGISKDSLLKLYRSYFGSLQKNVLKDLPGQNEEDSFPRAKLMADAYDMFLEHFGVTEKQVVEGYFQSEKTEKPKKVQKTEKVEEVA